MQHKMVGVSGGKTFSIEQVGIEQERETLVNMIALAPKASIIHVHAYESKNGYGEVANFFYLKGVDYSKMKERSLDTLNEIADNPDFSISVTRGVWKTQKGEINPTNRKSKTYSVFDTVTKIYNHDNELLTEAIAKVEQSILNTREQSTTSKATESISKKMAHFISEIAVCFIRLLLERATIRKQQVEN